MLGTKRRFMILFIIIFGGGIALSGVLIARILDLRTNLQNPLYFNMEFHSQFIYDNGTTEVYLDFDSIVYSDNSICKITVGTKVYTYNVTHEGYYIDPINGETRNFSIFWIGLVGMINGSGSETVAQSGYNYSVFDLIGLLGAPNTEYVLTVITDYNYWPEEAGVHGAQKSLIYVVRDLNGTKIVTGELDYTSGMLFYGYIGAGNIRYLKLIDTNYHISRNRLTGIPPAIAVAIATPVVVFCYLRFKKKETGEKLYETVFLITVGELVLGVDILIDVWMYAIFGLLGNLILHASLAGILAAYALYKRVGLKWVIPAFLEIAFIFAMTSYTGDSYVPHLTAFMGLTISYLCLLWISGYERIPSKSKLGKIISEFI